MKYYAVKKNRFDFKPNDQPLLTCKHRCLFGFILDESMWYRINDPSYPYGKYNGINKLGFGFTQGLFTNSKRTTTIGFFPSQETDYLTDVYLYINDKTGQWSATNILGVFPGQLCTGELSWQRYETIATLQTGDKSASASFPLERSNFLPMRGIGAWFGGQYPAFKDMAFQAEFEYF